MKNLLLIFFGCFVLSTAPAFALSDSPFTEDASAEFMVTANQLEATTAQVQKRYFPRAGDFAIGLDATPFLNYAGNMFNGTMNNSLNLGDNRLHFRYYLTDESAVRLSVAVFTLREVDMFYVDDQADQTVDPLSRAQVEDRRTTYSNYYEVKLGYLMFRGNNRLRGFFGGDVFFAYEKERMKYAYGNEMTALNSAPLSTVNWNNGATAGVASRRLGSTTGSVVDLGIGAVVGAEYYFMPKVSLGAEMGLVYAHSFFGQGNASSETMVGNLHVEEDTALTPGHTERIAFTGFPYTFGNLYLMIHF
ncbi:hypothetical protein QLX67_06170 [Balneolaceae bacterium ANBcel3]|nr:hypothetical protein [Balneolaceae bacterium ANBcel3]